MGDRPVLALHGWLDNAGSFDRLAPLLPGCDLVALDFPGHGRSGHRRESRVYHFVDWVADALATADHLGWSEFFLMGHSMGAGVATLLAGAFPSRVRGLILIEGTGPYTTPDEDAPDLLARSLLFRASQQRRYYPTREEAVERLASRGISQKSADCLAERALIQDPEGWYFNYAAEVRAPSRARLSEGQVRAFLRAISSPTLLVVAKDGLKFGGEMEGREHEIERLTRVDLEGHHHLHLDHPEPVAGAILDFVGSLD